MTSRCHPDRLGFGNVSEKARQYIPCFTGQSYSATIQDDQIIARRKQRRTVRDHDDIMVLCKIEQNYLQDVRGGMIEI